MRPGIEAGHLRYARWLNACTLNDWTIEHQVKNLNSIARPFDEQTWRHYRNLFIHGSGDKHIRCFHFNSRLNARSQTQWAIEDQVNNLNAQIQMYLYIHICISYVVAPICDLGRGPFEMIIDSNEPCQTSWRLQMEIWDKVSFCFP